MCRVCVSLPTAGRHSNTSIPEGDKKISHTLVHAERSAEAHDSALGDFEWSGRVCMAGPGTCLSRLVASRVHPRHVQARLPFRLVFQLFVNREFVTSHVRSSSSTAIAHSVHHHLNFPTMPDISVSRKKNDYFIFFATCDPGVTGAPSKTWGRRGTTKTRMIMTVATALDPK